MNFIPGDWVIIDAYLSGSSWMRGFVGQVTRWTSDHYVLTKFTKGKLHLFPSEIKPWVCKLGRW